MSFNKISKNVRASSHPIQMLHLDDAEGENIEGMFKVRCALLGLKEFSSIIATLLNAVNKFVPHWINGNKTEGLKMNALIQMTQSPEL